MKVPNKLDVGHKESTEQGKGEVIAIEGEIADILVGDEIIKKKVNGLSHIKEEKIEEINDLYLNNLVKENPEIWKEVQSNNWESCAWNITGSSELDDNLELLGFFEWIKKVFFAVAMKHNIELPDFSDSAYKKEFANRSCAIGKDNIGKLIDAVTKEYYNRFGENPEGVFSSLSNNLT